MINFTLKHICNHYGFRISLLSETKVENWCVIFRDLAEAYQVSWKEYWPFLNDFADFRTTEGLMKLEKYLEHRFQHEVLRYIQVRKI